MDTRQTGEIMSTRDAAKCLGVSVRTVQLWVESGNLEAWKTPGGHRRIYRHSVDNMLAARGVREVYAEIFEVMLCCDDEVMTGDLAAQLQSIGATLRLRCVFNGFDALAQTGEHCPDLLLIDLSSPDQGINKLFDALKSTSFANPLHLIAITSSGNSRPRLPPGVIHFELPVESEKLMRLLRLYVDLKRATDTIGSGDSGA